jgi:hypothetical protein
MVRAMKEIQPLEQFRFKLGIQFRRTSSRDCNLVLMFEAALTAMQLHFDTCFVDVGGVPHKEYIFLVDVREAAVILDIFDRMDNKLI